MRLWIFALAIALLSGSASGQSAATSDFFESKVRPVLAANCYGCHSNSAMGGLRVDSAEGLAKGGKRGPTVVPGDPGKSVLIEVITHSDPKQRMPMGGKLKDSEIAALTEWVKSGAVWPKPAVSAKTTNSGDSYVIHPEQRQFWSFQALKNPAPPKVKNEKWINTPSIALCFPASRKRVLRRWPRQAGATSSGARRSI